MAFPARPRPFSRLLGVPQKQSTRSYHMTAPVGGIDTVAPASAMPASDCIFLYNLIPFQYGLRVRSGWYEQATNVGTATTYNGPNWAPLYEYVAGVVSANGSNIYICTQDGISDSVGGPTGTGTGIVDGTCTWDYVEPTSPSVSYGLYDDGSPMEFALSAELGGAASGEWPGAQRNGVRSVLSFAGSNARGLNDRLFACTQDGIWDVSQPSSSPTRVYEFPVEDLTSGSGVGTSFTNQAGDHYLAYCDGTNGYILYSEKTDEWVKVEESPSTVWQPGTDYALSATVVNAGLAYICTKAGTSQAEWKPETDYVADDRRVNGGRLYVVVHGGTSATSGGPTGTEKSISDGTVTWSYVSEAGPWGADEAIADGTCTWDYYPTIFGVDPGSFRYVMSWKNRLWFCTESSAYAYYLPIGQLTGGVDITGTLDPNVYGGRVNFGARFKYGGILVGLWNWTVDGGVGIDDHLVGISSAGDVVVYTGSDPATDFGLKGVYWVGQVPPGRRIASAFGGDLFILSLVGCVPLSKLVAGYMIRDPNIYATAKVANLFNVLMTERGQLDGWSINIHPTDNLLIISVPATVAKPQEQLTMSMASKGWSRHLGVPMACMEAWRGKLYFGTFDNRVCANDGYVDGVKLDGTGSMPIFFSLLTSFQSLGSARKKRLHMAKPMFMTDGTMPGYEVQSRWDFDISDVFPTGTSQDTPDTSVWNSGLWDQSTWDDGAASEGRFYGASGMGTHLALVLKGTAKTNTTFIGFDAAIDTGGIL